MINLNTLNRRLILAFSGLSLIVCVFFIKLSTLLIKTSETNAYQTVLSSEVSRIQKQIQNTSLTLSSPLSTVKIYSDKSPPPILMQAHFAQSKSGNFYIESREDPNIQHIIFDSIETRNNKKIIIAMDISQLTANRDLNGFKSLFLYSISVSAMLLCLLSSWYLAKWLSTPIRLLTRDIAHIGAGNSSIIHGLERQDEIGQLANALNESYKKIQGLLEREQNFTRDVSHELRTPITLIKNTVALNPEKNLDIESTKVISQASNELEQTVEVLLALARQENLNFSELVLLPIIEKTVLNIYNCYPELVFNVSIKVDHTLRVKGNQYLISLLCQNLVNNGFYHSNSDGMKIFSQDNNLIFENKIKGDSVRPYYQGLGHGQYLVNRIAEEMGWKIMISQNDGLYRVTVQTI